MSYVYKATKTFWKSFNALSSDQQASAKAKLKIFKIDPFNATLCTHEIKSLSARAKRTIWAVRIENDLRAVFCIIGSDVITMDIGTHDIYK